MLKTYRHPLRECCWVLLRLGNWWGKESGGESEAAGADALMSPRRKQNHTPATYVGLVFAVLVSSPRVLLQMYPLFQSPLQAYCTL